MLDYHKRLLLAFSALVSWSLIFFAWWYLENTLYLPPCPLCMMQRVAFALIGLAFLVEAIFWPQKPVARTLSKLFIYLSIFFGIGLAARHLYIQSLPPDQIPTCGFDFWGTLSQNGFWAGIWQSMQGTGDCATVDKFMGFAIPMWSMIAYIGLLFIAIICGKDKRGGY